MPDKELSKHDLKKLKKLERQREREEVHQKHRKEIASKKTRKYIVISGIILLVVISIFFFLKSISRTGTYDRDNILDINLKEHSSVNLHIHPIVEIIILGEKQEISPNIGITSNGMRVIHTHESGGTLHVESPYPQEFYLKDFFTVWGKTFNESCIFEYCTDENHKLSMYVNGLPNEEYGELVLRDQDRIRLVYEKKQ